MHQPSAPRVLAAAIAAAMAVAGLATSALLTGGLPSEGGTGHAVVAPAVTSPGVVAAVAAVAAAPAEPSGPPPTLIATLHGEAPYSNIPGGQVVGTLAAANPFGGPDVLAVIGQPDPAGWLQVELPIRPNGSRGWIRAAGVSISQTSYRVVVNRETDRVTVTDAGKVVVSTPAAVGTPSTPTPAGSTYLWELVRPDDPTGAYGPYIFGLAMFSDAYAVFNGGDAQIGLHGQDEPWSIGHPVSHGCVRVGNDVISELVRMLPLGTPVTIV